MPSTTSYTLPSTSMPRGSAIPPTMHRFHPHVKGLLRFPPSTCPLICQSPRLLSPPNQPLYLDAIHPHASFSASTCTSTCTSCAAHLSTFQVCTRLHVMRMHLSVHVMRMPPCHVPRCNCPSTSTPCVCTPSLCLGAMHLLVL
ncbi:hypothetical protein M422DRAFT_40064 [Sphaerobolus stellatus SS14]|uniref:Uncharacterized protein n=1 Tax=Sphaerobolus stellatus (strain SS14) TaxID=990650 RepID=A0A0C9TKT2_SPHS4|nr:hypothetical protein M422DRAFT_40066 [Sphaerobolus stellatus SS14]KIJ22439.1 hypothetical protein M422DRAFT_40064 [Sphaerobolus stellatus SS14]